jgi:hypothetical protein
VIELIRKTHGTQICKVDGIYLLADGFDYRFFLAGIPAFDAGQPNRISREKGIKPQR